MLADGDHFITESHIEVICALFIHMCPDPRAEKSYSDAGIQQLPRQLEINA
jgi:hypothetical protein